MTEFLNSFTTFFNDLFGQYRVTPVDFMVAMLLLISALLAFFRGFTREGLSLIAWVGSFLAALYIHPYLLPYLAPYLGLEDDTILRFMLGAIIFFVFLTASSFIAISLSRMIKLTPIAHIDRMLGFAFGLFRGAFIACLIFAAYLQTQKETLILPNYVKNSYSYPSLTWGAETAMEILPGWANRLKSETLIKNRDSILEQQSGALEKTLETAVDKATTATEEGKALIKKATNQ